LKSRKQFRF